MFLKLYTTVLSPSSVKKKYISAGKSLNKSLLTFFYRDLPQSCMNAFQVETDSAKEKMQNLKQLIKGSGLEVFDG